MSYMCKVCGYSINLDDSVKYCAKCGCEIEVSKSPKKRIARIEGTLRGAMDVIIHEDGHVELYDLKYVHKINDDYKITSEREISDKEYRNL